MKQKSLFDLTGKVALVTGATSGMGKEICEALADFGADVACNARTEKKVKETSERLKRFGHNTIAIAGNAFEETDIKEMIDKTVRKLGSLDIVFAHAGILDDMMGKIHEIKPDVWDKACSNAIKGIYLLMKYSFPIMMKQKKGNFISTAAGTALWPSSPVGDLHLATPYITAKTAIIMLTKLAARQYGEYGIRANIICPGYHKSAFHEAGEPAKAKELEDFLISLTPLKRIGVASDIKGLAVFYASDASSFITGQIITEDGGFMNA